jgi:hypothetical protein
MDATPMEATPADALPADALPADAPVADAAPAVDSALEQCVLKQVGARLQRCCRVPGAIDTCYDIANTTVTTCGDAGPDGGPGGMVGTISCPAPPGVPTWYTPFNLIYVEGQGWCAVKTEGPKPTVYACKPKPDDFLLDFDLACTIMGIDTDGGICPCTIRNVTTNPVDAPSPSMCTTGENVTDALSCQACCAQGWRTECWQRGYPDTGDWQLACLKACDAYDFKDAGKMVIK